MTSTNLPGTASTGTVLSGYTFSSASGIGQEGAIADYTGRDMNIGSYISTCLTPIPHDPSGCYVSNTVDTYGIRGYLGPGSTVTIDVPRLCAENVRAGVQIGETTVNIIGTFTAEHNLYPQYVIQGAWGWAAGQRVDGTIPQWGYQYLVPTTYDYVGLPAGGYAQSEQVIAGSGNLTAGNIRSGVNIFNVVGTAPVLSDSGALQTAIHTGTNMIAKTMGEYEILIRDNIIYYRGANTGVSGWVQWVHSITDTIVEILRASNGTFIFITQSSADSASIWYSTGTTPGSSTAKWATGDSLSSYGRTVCSITVSGEWLIIGGGSWSESAVTIHRYYIGVGAIDTTDYAVILPVNANGWRVCAEGNIVIVSVWTRLGGFTWIFRSDDYGASFAGPWYVDGVTIGNNGMYINGNLLIALGGKPAGGVSNYTPCVLVSGDGGIGWQAIDVPYGSAGSSAGFVGFGLYKPVFNKLRNRWYADVNGYVISSGDAVNWYTESTDIRGAITSKRITCFDSSHLLFSNTLIYV